MCFCPFAGVPRNASGLPRSYAYYQLDFGGPSGQALLEVACRDGGGLCGSVTFKQLQLINLPYGPSNDGGFGHYPMSLATLLMWAVRTYRQAS
jgi:hypothetical protein